ncbi:hypothetical protein [Cellulosimicrobium funkei]|uniref:hypothetical protein n=1 Tax=Cellulosimicrobium funkei TaxID=264251 RepID=UPI0036BB319D
MDDARREELEDELRVQLQMLDRSCNTYDEGFDPAAREIAVRTRVLVYTRGNSSHGLVDQLGYLADLVLPDQRDWTPYDEEDPGFEVASETRFQPGLVSYGHFEDGTPPVYWPLFEGGNILNARRVPFESWWNDKVVRTRDDTVFSRFDLVKTLSNRDGGAHVDGLPSDYRALSRNGAFGWYNAAGDLDTSNPVPAAIRQVGEELRVGLRLRLGASLREAAAPVPRKLMRRKPSYQIHTLVMRSGGPRADGT